MSDENAEATNQSGDAQVDAGTATETTTAVTEQQGAATTTADATAADRSWQGRYDRLQSQVSKDLLGYVQTYGGGQNIVGFLKQFESLIGHQTLGPVVQGFLKTGQVELPKQKQANEWDEPAADEPWKQPMNSLLAELQQVRTSLNEVHRSQGMNAISDYTKRFAAEYPMDEHEKAQFSEHMDAKLAQLAASPTGPTLLKNIDYSTFKSIALPGIEESLDAIIRRRQEKARGNAAARATDAPGRVANGNERQTLAVPMNSQQHAQQVREAFRRAMAAT
jgi:hypothetical protein